MAAFLQMTSLVLANAFTVVLSAPPSVTLYHNANAVFGRAQYRRDSGVVRYLGEFEETEDCQSACLAYSEAESKCRSFAHHQAGMIDPNPKSFARLCYGIVDMSWGPHAETNVTSGLVHWPEPKCQTDEDCSLNGRCDLEAGRCHCLAAWSGSSCSVLSLLPAKRSSGLHAPTGSTPNVSSWGGSVAYDPASKRWHMFAAEMVANCGIGAWESNSRIVRASAAAPDGEYTVEAEIKTAFAHEPVLQHLEDGTWLLFSIGGNESSKGPLEGACLNGYTPKRGPHLKVSSRFDGPVPVEIHTANTLLGPWTNMGKAIGEGDINPAPYVFPNGTTIMMWRGGDAWYHVHLARATSWKDAPYHYNGSGTIFPGWDSHGIEDPFLYAQPWPPELQRGIAEEDALTYHAIFHDHSKYGGHAYSRDGVSWKYSPVVPFTNEVNYSDGGRVLLQRRERPHLIFDQHGFITHLTNGVQPPPSQHKAPPSDDFQNDYTYTLVQPVVPQSPSLHTLTV